MDVGSGRPDSGNEAFEPQLRRVGAESNGCVILAPGETVFDLHGRPGIWCEAHLASRQKKAVVAASGNPNGDGRAYADGGVVGMYAQRQVREASREREYTVASYTTLERLVRG